MKIAALVFVVTTLITGCASNGDLAVNENELAVEYATLKAIGDDAAKAERVLAIVERGRTFVNSDSAVSIAALDAGVREAIDWERLAPEDQILIREILSVATERLENEIGEGTLDKEQRVKIIKVLDWIEGAARLTIGLE